MDDISEDDRRSALREAKILEMLKHNNIIGFREVYKTNKAKLCIVMEYANDGDI